MFRIIRGICGNREPTFDVTSREAQYCIEKGIPLLSEEARLGRLIGKKNFPQDTPCYYPECCRSGYDRIKTSEAQWRPRSAYRS